MRSPTATSAVKTPSRRASGPSCVPDAMMTPVLVTSRQSTPFENAAATPRKIEPEISTVPAIGLVHATTALLPFDGWTIVLVLAEGGLPETPTIGKPTPQQKESEPNQPEIVPPLPPPSVRPVS